MAETSEKKTLVSVEHARKSFGSTEVLKDISLSVHEGEVLAIIGASGGGKSTLLRCCTLLETLDGGTLKFGDLVVARDNGTGVSVYADKKTQRKARERFGLVFQNFNLFPHYTVMKNIIDAPMRVQGKSREEAEAKGRELISKMGLEGKEDLVPCELSGGQQQRVAIARALANKPRIMLCDEATSALDTRTTAQILELLGTINRDLGVTMVMITHSLSVASRVCNRIAVIDDGRIVEQGATAEVFGNPRSEVTRELLRNDNLATADTSLDNAEDDAEVRATWRAGEGD